MNSMKTYYDIDTVFVLCNAIECVFCIFQLHTNHCWRYDCSIFAYQVSRNFYLATWKCHNQNIFNTFISQSDCSVLSGVMIDRPCLFQTALLPGVYCLLDLCDHHSVAVLHTVLTHGVRQVFSALHSDYSKYHKYKGKV